MHIFNSKKLIHKLLSVGNIAEITLNVRNFDAQLPALDNLLYFISNVKEGVTLTLNHYLGDLSIFNEQQIFNDIYEAASANKNSNVGFEKNYTYCFLLKNKA